MSEELKPCPWCGSEDVKYLRPRGTRINEYVICHDCHRGTVAEDGEAAWNALPRTVQAAPSDRERRLEEALRRCQRLADDGADDPAGPYNVMAHISNTAEAALSPEPWGGPEGEVE